MSACDAFLKARDQLLAMHEDYSRAYQEFRPPVLSRFNWGLDYFDRSRVTISARR
jgi:acetyl-CoA synthetase